MLVANIFVNHCDSIRQWANAGLSIMYVAWVNILFPSGEIYTLGKSLYTWRREFYMACFLMQWHKVANMPKLCNGILVENNLFVNHSGSIWQWADALLAII